MTQTEYEQKRAECWEEFMTRPHENPQSLRRCFDFAFDRAFALGKLQASCEQVKEEISQEKDAEETVIHGWVARDEDGELFLYIESPKREYGNWETPSIWASETFAQLDSTLFPDLTWESDPELVEIILKRKKK